MRLRYATVPTPVGDLTVVVGPAGVRQVAFDLSPDPCWTADGGIEAARQLRQYVRGERHVFELPLAPRGTPFQLQVWAVLRTIPFGHTTSYGALARTLGKPIGASRAIGTANGANPLAVVIPCHRVVGADGSLTGYAGGLHRKQWLLELERPERRAQQRLFA